MIKPETAFIQTVHRQLKKLTPPPLIKKLADRFTNGLPDVLYISPSGVCLWVEYKVAPNKLTALQQTTLETLMTYQQKIATITKTPQGVLIHDGRCTLIDNQPWLWITTQLEYPNATAPTTGPP